MSQTRQSSAAKMIKWLQKADNVQTPNLEKQFKKIEAMVDADPLVVYEVIKMTIQGIECEVSPLQFNCGTLDIHFYLLFLTSAIRTKNLKLFDEQVNQYEWNIDSNDYYQEYDHFYEEYHSMLIEGKTTAEISAVAVAKIGGMQRYYSRCNWDDIIRQCPVSRPLFNHIISGKNIGATTGEDIIGENYYVLSSYHTTTAYEPIFGTFYSVLLPTPTDQLPVKPDTVIRQRDEYLGYLQGRIDSRNSWLSQSRQRKLGREADELIAAMYAEKENRNDSDSDSDSLSLNY